MKTTLLAFIAVAILATVPAHATDTTVSATNTKTPTVVMFDGTAKFFGPGDYRVSCLTGTYTGGYPDFAQELVSVPSGKKLQVYCNGGAVTTKE